MASWLDPRMAYDRVTAQFGSIRRTYLGQPVVPRRDMGDHDEVVLLLHGFFQTRNIWEAMEDRLRHDGYGVMSFDLGGLAGRFNTRPVDELAEMMADKIERLADRYGFDALHLVGHSKGGLLARRYVQHHGGDRRAKSLITLGAPHHGTPTAVLGFALGLGLLTPNPRELLPRSDIVKALNRDTFPPHIPFHSLYSREDLVCPWWCSVLNPRPGEDAVMENVAVTGLGHSELCWDVGVYLAVRERLESAAALWAERHAHVRAVSPRSPGAERA